MILHLCTHTAERQPSMRNRTLVQRIAVFRQTAERLSKTAMLRGRCSKDRLHRSTESRPATASAPEHWLGESDLRRLVVSDIERGGVASADRSGIEAGVCPRGVVRGRHESGAAGSQHRRRRRPREALDGRRRRLPSADRPNRFVCRRRQHGLIPCETIPVASALLPRVASSRPAVDGARIGRAR